MKTKKIVGILLLIISLTTSCTKSDDRNESQAFCETEREFNEDLTDITAQLIYLENKNKFALKFHTNYPTVDEVTYCVICNQPDGIAIEDAVKFSGKSYFFNSNENFTPSVGGENFYYTIIEQIQKIDF